jgi:glycosyltransferase involved in cell wall biosynthesis
MSPTNAEELSVGSVPDTPAPQVSVVICTRNREDKIANAIESVLANEHPSFDVTVVDQSTSPATRLVVSELAERDPRVHYLYSEKAGLSRAYNTGIAAARGAIIAFTDDDCIAGADWIDSIVAAFDAEPDAELLYGTVIPFGSATDDVAKTPMVDWGVPRRLSRRDGFFVAGMGANFAARRQLFERVGPFDNVLGGGGALRSSQDFDMTYRTFKTGGVVLLRPDVIIRHDGRREEADWPALLVAYGTGDGGFYAKHVRCRDPYALWLVVGKLGKSTGKWLVKGMRGQKPMERYYVRGVLTGVRQSFRFRVDRTARLYVEP